MYAVYNIHTVKNTNAYVVILVRYMFSYGRTEWLCFCVRVSNFALDYFVCALFCTRNRKQRSGKHIRYIIVSLIREITVNTDKRKL